MQLQKIHTNNNTIHAIIFCYLKTISPEFKLVKPFNLLQIRFETPTSSPSRKFIKPENFNTYTNKHTQFKHTYLILI